LFGLLLSPVLLLAQSPIDRIGEVTVSSVDVTTTSSVSSQHLQQIAQEIQSQSYAPSQLEESVQRARYMLQTEGYFKADVSLKDVRSVDPIGGTIAVTLAIKEGQQYQLKQITFSGNMALPASQLRQQFEIADGAVFDVEQIRKGLEQIRKLYFRPGLERRVSPRCRQAARTHPAADHSALRTSCGYCCPRRRQPLRDKPQVAGMEDLDRRDLISVCEYGDSIHSLDVNAEGQRL